MRVPVDCGRATNQVHRPKVKREKIHGLFALGIKPKRRDEPTSTVDAEGNNLFMGGDQKATNEGGRGLRTHNIVVDWLSHWFHVAGIKHKGGFRGRPDTARACSGASASGSG